MGSRSLDTNWLTCSVFSPSSPPPLRLPNTPMAPPITTPSTPGTPLACTEESITPFRGSTLLHTTPPYPFQATAPVAPQGADTRQLIKFQNFQEINANFVEQTDATTMAATPTTTASQVIVGTVNIQQNLVTDFLNGNEAQYKINVRTTGTLDLTGQNIMVGIASDCITPASGTGVVATINVPPTLNGFYVAGRTTGFNIDGMNSMTSLRGMRMQILNAAGDMIIGCTSDAALN